MTQPKLTAHEVRRIAVAAACDPRSVRAYFAEDRRTRSTTDARIEAALRSLGIPGPPASATPATEPAR